MIDYFDKAARTKRTTRTFGTLRYVHPEKIQGEETKKQKKTLFTLQFSKFSGQFI